MAHVPFFLEGHRIRFFVIQESFLM